MSLPRPHVPWLELELGFGWSGLAMAGARLDVLDTGATARFYVSHRLGPFVCLGSGVVLLREVLHADFGPRQPGAARGERLTHDRDDGTTKARRSGPSSLAVEAQ